MRIKPPDYQEDIKADGSGSSLLRVRTLFACSPHILRTPQNVTSCSIRASLFGLLSGPPKPKRFGSAVGVVGVDHQRDWLALNY